MAKINITDRAIRALKPPELGAEIHYDREIPGFGVRVTAAGVASFILNYSLDGKERRLTIARCAEMPAATGRARALELRQQVRDGKDPQAERPEATSAGRTVNDLAAEYLENHVGHKADPKNDRYMIDGIIRPQLGELPLTAVTKQTIEKLHQVTLKATPTNANRVLSLLRRMFSVAVELGWRADNPARKIPLHTEDKNNDHLSADELERLKAALDGYKNQDVANAIRLLMYTGARQGEVIRATWDMFEPLERGNWTKPSHHVKERKQQVTPLNDAAQALLRQMYAKRTGPYLFPAPKPLVKNPGGHKSKHSPTRQGLLSPWRTISKAAGLVEAVEAKRPENAKPSWRRHVRPRYVIHVLRHTFASQLVSKGVTLPVIGELLGHTQPETTQRYASVSNDAQRAAANRFEVSTREVDEAIGAMEQRLRDEKKKSGG